MPYGKEIKVKKDDQEAVIQERSLPVYERNGWTRADDGSSGQSAPEAPDEMKEG
jgi:hypothetical protein